MDKIIYNGYDKAGFYRFTKLNEQEEIIEVIKIPKTRDIYNSDEQGNPIFVRSDIYLNKDEALAAYLSSSN
jgi:hypothetical protein